MAKKILTKSCSLIHPLRIGNESSGSHFVECLQIHKNHKAQCLYKHIGLNRNKDKIEINKRSKSQRRHSKPNLYERTGLNDYTNKRPVIRPVQLCVPVFSQSIQTHTDTHTHRYTHHCATFRAPTETFRR